MWGKVGQVSAEFGRRAFWSVLVHADEYHLYWNMGSLLSKGASLEASIGSVGLGVTTLCLACLTQAVYLLVAVVFAGGPAWLDVWNVCCVGFSGILFAYKVVLDAGDPAGGWRSLMGFQVPVAWAAWGELFIASLLNPRASFVGHLSGIAAGYVWLLCGGPERLLAALRGAGVGMDDDGSGLLWGADGRRAAAAARGQAPPPMQADLSSFFRAVGFGSGMGAQHGMGGFGNPGMGGFGNPGMGGFGAQPQAPFPAPAGRRRQDWGGGAVGATDVAADEALARALQEEEDRRARG
jgi:membrane associated rhomboid family serine protease